MRRASIGVVVASVMLMASPGTAQSPSPEMSPCPVSVAVPIFAPALVGLTVADADAIAVPVGLTVFYVDEPRADAEPGSIVSQDPLPGATLAGTQITATVAIAPVATATPSPTKAPPSLTDMPFARLKAMAQQPRYRAFFRNAESFRGDLVYFKGRVLQFVPREERSADVLVQVTRDRFGFWSDIVWVYYVGRRLIPGDMIELVGRGADPVTYESAGQGTLTVPAVSVIQARRIRP